MVLASSENVVNCVRSAHSSILSSRDLTFNILTPRHMSSGHGWSRHTVGNWAVYLDAQEPGILFDDFRSRVQRVSKLRRTLLCIHWISCRIACVWLSNPSKQHTRLSRQRFMLLRSSSSMLCTMFCHKLIGLSYCIHWERMQFLVRLVFEFCGSITGRLKMNHPRTTVNDETWQHPIVNIYPVFIVVRVWQCTVVSLTAASTWMSAILTVHTFQW